MVIFPLAPDQTVINGLHQSLAMCRTHCQSHNEQSVPVLLVTWNTAGN